MGIRKCVKRCGLKMDDLSPLFHNMDLLADDLFESEVFRQADDNKMNEFDAAIKAVDLLTEKRADKAREAAAEARKQLISQKVRDMYGYPAGEFAQAVGEIRYRLNEAELNALAMAAKDGDLVVVGQIVCSAIWDELTEIVESEVDGG